MFNGLYEGDTGMADASSALKNILPYNSVYYAGKSSAPTVQPQITTPTAPSSSSVPGIDKFANFVKTVATDFGHLSESAFRGVVHSTENMAKGVWNFLPSTYHLASDAIDTYNQHNAVNHLLEQQQNLNAQWKSGRISTAEFKSGLKDIVDAQNKLTKEISATSTRIGHDGQAEAINTIQTAAAIITVMTAGVGGLLTEGASPEVMSAVDYFTGDVASLKAGEAAIGKLALNKQLYENLSDGVKGALTESMRVAVNGSSKLTAGNISRVAITNLALKYPLYFSSMAYPAEQVYQELNTGKYGDAAKNIAIDAAIAVGAGPFGQFLGRGAKAGLGYLSKSTFDRAAYIDELAKLVGSKLPGHDPQVMLDAIANNPKLIKNISSNEAINLYAADNNPVKAVYRLADAMARNDGTDIAMQHPAQFLQEASDHIDAAREFDTYAKQKNLGLFVPGRWTMTNRNFTASMIQDSTRGVAKNEVQGKMLETWENIKSQFPNSSYANSPSLDRQIKNIIMDNPKTPGKVAKEIRKIEAGKLAEGFPSPLIMRNAEKGFIPIQPTNLEAPFREGSGKITSNLGKVSPLAEHGQDPFIKASHPLPVLSWVGTAISKAGLSPVAAQQSVQKEFRTILAKRLGGADLLSKVAGKDGEDKADYLIKQLSNKANEINQNMRFRRAQINDLRFLTVKDIMEATKVSDAEARQLRGMIIDSYIQVPYEIRGMGDRVVDWNYKLNPLAKPYARVQGSVRFAYNPIFQARVSYKGEFLKQLQTRGSFPTITGLNWLGRFFFRGTYRQLDSTVALLDSHGLYGAGGAMEQAEGFSGSAVRFINGEQKGIQATLSQAQKRIGAGLVVKMADRVGLPVEDFIKQYPTEARNGVQALFHYDPRASFLNSPLTKTLNIAFFPFRFETKVAMYMAKALTEATPMTRYAVTMGMLDAHRFLQSEAGMAWYAQYQPVIGFLQYFSPLETLSQIANQLTGVDNLIHGEPYFAGQFGELGGLPFGWIPQLLDSAGLTHFAEPFVSSTTGQPAKEYVPTDAFGEINAAIQDLVGQLFTYPGSEVGLPSKGSIERFIAGGVDPWGKKAFNAENPPAITPQQQQYSAALMAKHADVAPPINYNAGPTNTFNVNPTSPSAKSEITSTSHYKTYATKQAKAKKGRLKKSDFTPYLLPGQSKLGQL